MSAEAARVRSEAARRRTFAIISHPDAGKTTLTEKFLLYAGAIAEAGAVKARKVARTARSDWMQMEQDRGISISTTVLRFDHHDDASGNDLAYNLLDTPGHRDFSEDTYRVLSGVDAAIMVLDAAAGVEPQTKKLFEVCARRGTPLITFINKLDRPSRGPLELLDDIEEQLGVVATPVTWPVRTADGVFRGVVDRRDRTFHRYDPDVANTRRQAATTTAWDPGDVDTGEAIDDDLALLDELDLAHDPETFLAGRTTPVFFGSALNNFGVEPLLDAIATMAPPPQPRPDVHGTPRPVDAAFSGFVFKVQANMDPRHRDRIAFVRICSGRFERDSQLTCTRTGRTMAAKYAHQVFGRERVTVDEAFPGDVVGLVNATDLHIGDSLHDGDEVTYPAMPVFTPEHFRVATPGDRSRVKQFRTGIDQLDQEGVIQVLRHPELGDQAPVLAAVGALQFEVAAWRMEHEFGSPVRIESTAFHEARRTTDDAVDALRRMRDVEVYRRASGTPIALFRDRWQVERILRDHPELPLDKVSTT